jgi:hypothetical protein
MNQLDLTASGMIYKMVSRQTQSRLFELSSARNYICPEFIGKLI